MKICNYGYKKKGDLMEVNSYRNQLSPFISATQLFMREEEHTNCFSQAHMVAAMEDTYTLHSHSSVFVF